MENTPSFRRAIVNIQVKEISYARRNLLMGWSLTLITELLVSSKEWPSARGGEGLKIVLGFFVDGY
jgi:hypothetical protein